MSSFVRVARAVRWTSLEITGMQDNYTSDLGVNLLQRPQ